MKYSYRMLYRLFIQKHKLKGSGIHNLNANYIPAHGISDFEHFISYPVYITLINNENCLYVYKNHPMPTYPDLHLETGPTLTTISRTYMVYTL